MESLVCWYALYKQVNNPCILHRPSKEREVAVIVHLACLVDLALSRPTQKSHFVPNAQVIILCGSHIVNT